jgi:hypothetical protein
MQNAECKMQNANFILHSAFSILHLPHSYLSASIGSSRDAFHAG